MAEILPQPVHERWSAMSVAMPAQRHRLLLMAPTQAPEPARREDKGQTPETAERPEGPDEEEASTGFGDLAVMRPPHVHYGHGCREQPDEQHDDVSRSPLGEHQRPVQENDQNEQRSVRGLRLRYPTDDVVRNVKRQQKYREQRRDDQGGVLLHSRDSGDPRALEQPACDEERIRHIEKRLRLFERGP